MDETMKVNIYVEEETIPYRVLEIPLTKEGDKSNEDNS